MLQLECVLFFGLFAIIRAITFIAFRVRDALSVDRSREDEAVRRREREARGVTRRDAVERRDRAFAMSAQGATIGSIAEELGVSERTVGKYLRELSRIANSDVVTTQANPQRKTGARSSRYSFADDAFSGGWEANSLAIDDAHAYEDACGTKDERDARDETAGFGGDWDYD